VGWTTERNLRGWSSTAGKWEGDNIGREWGLWRATAKEPGMWDQEKENGSEGENYKLSHHDHQRMSSNTHTFNSIYVSIFINSR
jgi:hypothetical protein